jgi:hypothetical protein
LLHHSNPNRGCDQTLEMQPFQGCGIQFNSYPGSLRNAATLGFVT